MAHLKSHSSPVLAIYSLATCKNYLNVRNELKADTAEVEKQHVLQFPLPNIGIPVLVRNVFYEFDKADDRKFMRSA